MKTRCIFYLLVILFAGCAYKGGDRKNKPLPPSEEQAIPEREIVKGTGEADASHQEEANQGWQRLMVSYGRSENGLDTGVVYPDYYGGAYITPDGDLFIYLAGDEKEMESYKREVIAIAKTNRIQFGRATYSYAYLSALMDELNDFMINKKNPEIASNVAVYSLMDKENCIEMGLIDASEKKISEFKKHVSNSPAIHFKQSEPIRLN